MMWQNLGVKLTPLTVNVAPRQFLQDDMVATVRAILDRTGLRSADCCNWSSPRPPS